MAGSSADFDRAFDGVVEFFRPRQTRAGVVARRILGIPRPDDDRLVTQLIRERRRRTRMDGGVGGWVVATAWSALELLQLGCPHDHTGLSRMLGYILARQDKAGRFGEGCSERRHPLGHCHHFLSGFFSPGSKDISVAPLALPSGVVITSEWEARFAASCFALRIVLQGRREKREAVQRHLESLLHLAERWDRDEFEPAPDLVFFALAAVAMAPLHYRQRVDRLVDQLVARQQDDGTWPDASLFHVVDAMLLFSGPVALDAVRRCGPTIVARQHASGAFDESENEEMALIALRALRARGVGGVMGRAPRLASPTTSQRG